MMRLPKCARWVRLCAVALVAAELVLVLDSEALVTLGHRVDVTESDDDALPISVSGIDGWYGCPL